MNLYNCKVGDVVITGDQYGVSPCVCVQEKHYSEEYGFDVVTFLDLTSGVEHDSGKSPDSGFPLDSCNLIDRISVGRVERIKRVWKNDTL